MIMWWPAWVVLGICLNLLLGETDVGNLTSEKNHEIPFLKIVHWQSCMTWSIIGLLSKKKAYIDARGGNLAKNFGCGPCKIMAPKFQDLSEKYVDVLFLKLDCNQENRPLAKELGIKVVPTFKILKDGKVVKEVTGSKFDELVHAIDTVKKSS